MKIITPLRAAELRMHLRALSDAQYQAVKDLLASMYHDVSHSVALHRAESGTDQLLMRAGTLRGIESVAELLEEIRRAPAEDGAKVDAEGGAA